MKYERITLNLDRAQLDEAMKKAAGEGVDMKVAGNQSALVRALVEAYLGREAKGAGNLSARSSGGA